METKMNIITDDSPTPTTTFAEKGSLSPGFLVGTVGTTVGSKTTLGNRKTSDNYYVDYPEENYANYRSLSYRFTYKDLDQEALATLQKTCHELLRRAFRSYTGNNNFMVSPLSAYLTLNLIKHGAGNETRRTINRILFCKNEQNELKSALQLWRMLNNDRSMLPTISMGMFIKKGFEVKNEFSSVLRNDFAGICQEVEENTVNDEENPDSQSGANKWETTIGDWVKHSTMESLAGITNEVDENSKLGFFEVSFWKSWWDTEFPAVKTKPGAFKGLKDKQIIVEYLCSQDTYQYLNCEEEGFSVAFFPFDTEVYGNEWEMAIFLPTESLEPLRTISHFMKAKQIRRLLKKSEIIDIDVKLPIFAVDYELDVMKLMETFGVQNMGKNADFSNICEPQLPVDFIIQKSSISIGEEGIATANDLQTSVPEKIVEGSRLYTQFSLDEELTEFHVNKPFAFCVFQPRIGLVLSAGIVYDPIEELRKNGSRKSDAEAPLSDIEEEGSSALRKKSSSASESLVRETKNEMEVNDRVVSLTASELTLTKEKNFDPGKDNQERLCSASGEVSDTPSLTVN